MSPMSHVHSISHPCSISYRREGGGAIKTPRIHTCIPGPPAPGPRLTSPSSLPLESKSTPALFFFLPKGVQGSSLLPIPILSTNKPTHAYIHVYLSTFNRAIVSNAPPSSPLFFPASTYETQEDKGKKISPHQISTSFRSHPASPPPPLPRKKHYSLRQGDFFLVWDV